MDYDQSLITNLNDLRTFLNHIQPKVAEGAFQVIDSICDEAIEQVKDVQYAKEELDSYANGGDSKFIRDAHNYLKNALK